MTGLQVVLSKDRDTEGEIKFMIHCKLRRPSVDCGSKQPISSFSVSLTSFHLTN